MILGLIFALIIGTPQQNSGSAGPQAAAQQRAHDEYERHKQEKRDKRARRRKSDPDEVLVHNH